MQLIGTQTAIDIGGRRVGVERAHVLAAVHTGPDGDETTGQNPTRPARGWYSRTDVHMDETVLTISAIAILIIALIAAKSARARK